MKHIITPSQPLNHTVNGAAVTPELSRHFTKKQGGHHLMLRVRKDRQVLAYLSTELYPVPAAFNPTSKQLADPVANERLRTLFSRACKLVATTTDPVAIKAGWERVLTELAAEQQANELAAVADNFRTMFKGDDYVSLINKRLRLEKELLALDEQISLLEKDPTIPKYRAKSTRNEGKEYDKALAAFMANHSTLKPRDKQMWNSWLKIINECAEKNSVTLSLQVFDMAFYARYKTYIMGTRGNSLNTFGAHVKRLKSFLKYAESNGYEVGNGWKDKRFTISEESKQVVYLDDEELSMLWAYRLIEPQYTKQIELTIFQSLTGLRISDAAKKHVITSLKIKGGTAEYLTGTCKKNGGKYKVPLSLDARIKEILLANNSDMKIISEPVYNRTIKAILQSMYAHYKMEVPTIVVERETLSGLIETPTPKNELIATHSNRRSFISRHINSDEFNVTDILSMLGSTDVKELQRYILTDDGSLNRKATANAVARQTAQQYYMKVA